MKNKDYPIKLFKDDLCIGIFNNEKQAKNYMFNWEHSYFNQDEFDVNYKPNWKIERMEDEKEDY